MRKYKIQSIKQRSMLGGRLTPEQLEKALNENAAKGWIFDRALGGETWLMGRDTIMLVFYRDT